MDTFSIPVWVVGLNLLLAGFMWLVTRNTRIRMDSRIWGNTMFLIGILYMLSALNPNPSDATLAARINGSRLMISIISLSQWFPLLVSYFRSLNNTRRMKDGLVGDNNNFNRRS